MKKWCTINGITLEEHLKSKESIEEEIERTKLFSEVQPTVHANYKPRLRYKDHTERNGKVIHMSLYEINKRNLDNALKELSNNRDWVGCVAAVIFAHPDKQVLTGNDIVDYLRNFEKKHGSKIHFSSNGLRRYFGLLRKSDAAQDMIFTHQNPGYNRKTTYEFTDEARNNLHIDDIVKSANTPGPLVEYINVKSKPKPEPEPKIEMSEYYDTSEPEVNTEPVNKIDLSELPPQYSQPDEPVDVTKTLLDIIKNLSITITGDIHIYVGGKR
jgi:hypothetical protein